MQVEQTIPEGIVVPEGFNLHTENNSHILLSSNEAFLNPVQEFNRDLSVACIRVWSEEWNKEKEARWQKVQDRKASKSKANKRAKCAFCSISSGNFRG